MTLVKASTSAIRRAGTAVARAGLALLRFWCLPTLGADEAAELHRKRATYQI